jgi:hypothetical protein
VPEHGAINSTTDKITVPDVASAENDIVNTTTETSVYSYSIGANVLGADGAVRLTMHGDYKNDSGSAQTFTLKVKFGSTTMFEDVSASIPDFGASRLPWWMQLVLANKNATNSQTFGSQYMLTSIGAGTGVGRIDTDELYFHGGPQGSASEDTTGALTLDITITHAAAHADLSYRRHWAMLELINT